MSDWEAKKDQIWELAVEWSKLQGYEAGLKYLEFQKALDDLMGAYWDAGYRAAGGAIVEGGAGDAMIVEREWRREKGPQDYIDRCDLYGKGDQAVSHLETDRQR